MNLEVLLSHDVTIRLGWTLLHFLWQGAAVGLLAIGLLWGLKSHGANVRYAVACGALVLMASLPVLTLRASASNGESPVEALAAGRARLATASPSVDVATTRVAQSTPHRTCAPAPTFRLQAIWRPRPPVRAWLATRLEHATPWLALCWLIGAAVLAVRLSGGWAVVQLLRRNGVRPARRHCQEALGRLVHRLQLTRTVQLLESSVAKTPLVIGWLRPLILVPSSAVLGLSAAQLEALLAHELAHIRRHDYLVNLLQSVVEVLLFYHPAVWWVSGRIRVEREHCCDDVAAALCEDRVLYAQTLTALEESRGARTEPAVAAASGRLFTRIRRIAEPPQSDERPGGWLAGVAALAIGVLLLTTLLLPPRQATGQAARDAQVALVCAEDVPETYREPVAEVVRVAKQAFDARFPEFAKEEIALRVLSAADGYWEGALTDRRNTIYLRVGRHGLGEYFRPDADPVTILCQAVAELHNPNRLAGFDRFIAHRYLVPEVVERLGAEPLPGARLDPDAEDPTGRLVLMADPVYASVHPDFAAASAMADIEQALGFEALTELLAEGLSSATDPFSAFRAAALAREPTLADAFTLRDEAVRLEVRPDGTSVVASFEPDEGVRVLATFGSLSSLGDTPIVATDVYQPSFSDE